MNKSNFGQNDRKVPPCGRLIEHQPPHSPFQKLIDSRRKRCGLSGRELADRIGVPQSSLYIWLHNLNGYPHPKSCKPEHLCKLCEVLKIPEAKLKSALDASRHIFTATEHPTPHEAFDVFGHFIQILEHDKRRHVSKEYVLNLAKNLHRGAKVTLLALSALIALSVTTSADDLQSLVTLKGDRFEKARVTEVTPVSITIVHSRGVARVPFTEFGLDIQKKYGYDEAKARTCVAEQISQAAKARQEQHQREIAGREQMVRNMEAVEAYHASLGPGELYYDPVTKEIRNADLEVKMRGQLLREALRQRYLSGAPPLASSPTPR